MPLRSSRCCSLPFISQIWKKGFMGHKELALDQALDEFVDDRIGSISLKEYYELTKDDPFAELVTPDTVASFAERGLLHLLLAYEVPVFREFLDTPTFPCILITPSLDEIEAIEDLERRAQAIQYFDIRAIDERTRNLILSVDGSSWTGIAAQGNLYPPEPKRRGARRPGRRRDERTALEPNLWELFKIEEANDNN